ncbi:uncharacterized protein LOC133179152 isoform X2 [Saccostrea echinata]|uniref:uncharacterized protein LOC133179152 isoform X2 n=1 Tax=Saccostrea echinata TaxID=191078 RepID=UPI002A81CB3E|nr:uncharacterized protein LOC133179152 isoform X2 [Saccostrea echinata]
MSMPARFMHVFLIWISLANSEQFNTQVSHPCNIVQSNMTRFGIPKGQSQIKCGGDFILPECVCTYHHVADEEYHDYTACRNNDQADSIKHMKCEQCEKHSVHNAGPCLNGGTINCSPGDLASDLSCLCLDAFSGRFCEYRNSTVYRKCQSGLKTSNLPDCNDTSVKECQTSLEGTVFVCLDYSEDEEYNQCRPNPEYTAITTYGSPAHLTNSCSISDETFQTLMSSIILQYLLCGSSV